MPDNQYKNLTKIWQKRPYLWYAFTFLGKYLPDNKHEIFTKFWWKLTYLDLTLLILIIAYRHHIKNRLINGMYCLPFFILLVLLVATAKIDLEDQEL